MMKRVQIRDYDVISNLPTNITDTILTCLPLREAVRTSILSKKWRYSWTSISKLAFDDTICKVPLDNEMLLRLELISFINHIMLFHQGPIRKFSISHSALKSCPEIDHLLIFLSKSGMKQFKLELLYGSLYILPFSFFTCQGLTHLNLSSCVFRPPPAFKGFRKLISLRFYNVTFDTHLFENFISNCPRLERLTLIDPPELQCLNIRAATLKFLQFDGICKFLCFENVPLLKSVIMFLDLPKEDRPEEEKACRLHEFFGCMPSLENLTTDDRLFRCLAAGSVQKKLPNSMNLKILTLYDVSFNVLDETSCLYALISSSPSIQRIDIQLFPEMPDDDESVLEFLNTLDHSGIILDKLQEVVLTDVQVFTAVLKFIELLLAKSPVLDTMLIKPLFEDEGFKLLKNLTRFQRKSPTAKIIYVEV